MKNAKNTTLLNREPMLAGVSKGCNCPALVFPFASVLSHYYSVLFTHDCQVTNRRIAAARLGLMRKKLQKNFDINGLERIR